MQWWQVAAAANGVVAVAYSLISVAIYVPLSRARQLGSNRLGTATALIFFSCAVGHGLHGVHGLLPYLGISGPEAEAARSVEAHDAVWAVLTALIGTYYWTLRRSYGQLLEGASLFHDPEAARRQAFAVNDSVVQSLAAAKLALHLGRDADLDAALDAALASSQEFVARLLTDAAATGSLSLEGRGEVASAARAPSG